MRPAQGLALGGPSLGKRGKPRSGEKWEEARSGWFRIGSCRPQAWPTQACSEKPKPCCIIDGCPVTVRGCLPLPAAGLELLVASG